MNQQEWSHHWHHNQLNVSLLQAFYSSHAYPKHSHDYYVVALVDKGVQSFTCAGSKHITPVDGLILLNPGDVHTGEPANQSGFEYRAFYPTVEHMKTAMQELTGRDALAPCFSAAPRADDIPLAHSIRSLHTTLRSNASLLECESKFLWTLVQLVKQFGDRRSAEQKNACEHQAIQKACAYIHENYAQSVSLSQLAEHVYLSRYYLLRTFRGEMGMPPHAYLENIRIRQAQKLLTEETSLAQVAYAVGFGSQSHFTQRFKQIIGVTPGEYAKQRKQV